MQWEINEGLVQRSQQGQVRMDVLELNVMYSVQSLTKKVQDQFHIHQSLRPNSLFHFSVKHIMQKVQMSVYHR